MAKTSVVISSQGLGPRYRCKGLCLSIIVLVHADRAFARRGPEGLVDARRALVDHTVLSRLAPGRRRTRANERRRRGRSLAMRMGATPQSRTSRLRAAEQGRAADEEKQEEEEEEPEGDSPLGQIQDNEGPPKP